MSYLKTGDNELCSGCRVCADVCPKECITFSNDSSGFTYPQIDTKECINCNLCVNVCPVSQPCIVEKKSPLHTYVAVHKDEKVLTASASGGAFSALASILFENNKNAVIYGSRFEKNHQLVIDTARTLEEIEPLRKSKYLQNNPNHCYRKVKDDLKAGKTVLFSSVPCQIAALYNYLGVDYDNLICIDLVCHGVPSQKQFDSYISNVEKKYHSKVKNYTFRNKSNRTNKMTNSTVLIELENGRIIVKDSIDDPYLRVYHARMNYRPSCYQCKFACNARLGDITIADAHGIEQIYSDMSIRRGASAILVNTPKGEKIATKLSNYMKVRKIDYSFLVSINDCLREPTKKPKQRELFLQRLEIMTFFKAANKTLNVKLPTRILRKILPSKQLEIIRKTAMKILKRK